ncbi:uncharacterized protein LOC107473841 [Arachis duranensis]|uniref:Uncharacterized protein LOC107473841 n=1 Tax=Arachis duranensis TaxID=130453 RepID=A0A6P4CCQ2_ARADU|nr:uncharacterized protein LOC107473841 [Arachis duranensis]
MRGGDAHNRTRDSDQIGDTENVAASVIDGEATRLGGGSCAGGNGATGPTRKENVEPHIFKGAVAKGEETRPGRSSNRGRDTQGLKLDEQMLKNRKTWELAKESGVVLVNEEEDIMAILQSQNEETERKRKLAKQKEKLRRGLRGDGKVVTRFDVARLWGQGGAGWDFVGSDSAAGGLLLIWDESVFKKNNCYKEERWLCVKGVLVKNNYSCAIFLVYGAHNRDAKLQVWEEMSYMVGLCQVPSCYMEDFNEIVHVEERQGTDVLPRSAEEFRSWIQDMHLVDLPLTNRKFTWFQGHSCSRIDRALVSMEWLEEFLEARICSEPRGLLDHCPVILEYMGQRVGPRPFRSLDLWFTHEGFLNFVKEEWRGLGEMKFTDKLKALTVPLRNWHKSKFGDMDKKITRFEEEIKKIDDLVSTGVYDETMEARRKALVTCCERWYARKEVHWKQMSRSRLVRNQARIKIAIKEYYKELYQQDKSPLMSFRDGLVSRIEQEDSVNLEALPTPEEIREAVWDCESSKAPRCDGYNMNFVKRYWAEIGPTTAVMGFFQTSRLPTDSNITWVALAPKFTGVKEIKDL